MSVADTSASAIRGWECTPTDDPPRATTSSGNDYNANCASAPFIRGWRRNALYGIILFLIILVFLNIALTLWIISALNLNMNGIGPIRIIKGGVQLQGQAWVKDNLIASTIISQIAQPITLHSHRNLTILVSRSDHADHSKLFIKRGNIEFSGRLFNVRDARGDIVFQASRDEVRVFAETFAIDGVGGLVVKNALQSPFIRAPPGSDLQLESLTRRLDLRAPQSIYFESRAGGIDLTSHNDIKLSSLIGTIKLDAPNIIINNLKTAHAADKPQRGLRNMKVYQLCACATGKLFLAVPEAPCATTDGDTEVCR